MYKKACILFLVLCGLAINVSADSKLDSMYGVANGYFHKGNYAANLKVITAVLKTAEQTGNCADVTYAMIKIGGAYYFLQQRRECLDWMFKARAKAIACHIDSSRCITARQMGAIYYELGKFDSAMIYMREAERLLEHTERWSDKAALYAVMGEIYISYQKDTAGAERYFRNALVFAEKSNDSPRMAYANIHMGTYLNYVKQYKNAMPYFNTALRLYAAAHLVEGVMYAKACQASSLCYASKDAMAVYTVMSDLKTMRDSIFKEETALKTAEYRTLYETEKKQKENLLLAKDNALKKLQIAEEVKNKRILTVIFISGIIILLLLFLFAYNRYKQKQEAELERKLALQQKLRFKAVLEAEEKERVRIARELHDSLGQMLSAAKMNMSAMDSFNEEDAKLMGNAKKLVDDSVKEVRAISHNLMPSTLMDKGIVTALNELANKINDTGLMHIDLVVNDADTRLDSSVEIAIYRIVQEVVNNMIKHSKANTVEIMLDYNTEKIYLSIKDNGVGFDTNTIEQSSGIGWKNIFSRVYMMNGDVQIDSQPGRGTLVNIEFSK